MSRTSREYRMQTPTILSIASPLTISNTAAYGERRLFRPLASLA